MRNYWRDSYFRAAFAAAPVFWLIYYLFVARREDVFAVSSNNFSEYLLVVLLYPVLEELAFRGFIQGQLLAHCFFKRECYGVTFANVVTSAIFVGFHFLSQPIIWALVVFFPSLVFGFFRDRFQCVQAGILLHIFYNAGWFALYGF